MLLGWIIRLLLVVLVVRAVWSFAPGLFAWAAKSPRVPPQPSMPLVRDPVCGTYVEPSRALTAKAGTRVHYFCSETCRQTFRQSA